MPDYRVLVTGSRNYARRDLIRSALQSVMREHPSDALVLVHGMCDPRNPRTGHAVKWAPASRLPPSARWELAGADWLAANLAAHYGWDTEPHPADWQRHGKSGGFRRNELMVKLGADLCLSFPAPCTAPRCKGRPDHDSHGTVHCMGVAEKAGIQVRRFAAT